MTIKEVAEKIKQRLEDGRGQAMGKYTCQYRTPQGVPCVVGCLFSDELYKASMEGETTSYLEVFENASGQTEWRSLQNHLGKVLNAAEVPATDECLRLLCQAQKFHDAPKNWNGNTYIGPKFWEQYTEVEQ